MLITVIKDSENWVDGQRLHNPKPWDPAPTQEKKDESLCFPEINEKGRAKTRLSS